MHCQEALNISKKGIAIRFITSLPDRLKVIRINRNFKAYVYDYRVIGRIARDEEWRGCNDFFPIEWFNEIKNII